MFVADEMDLLLKSLRTKAEIDHVIRDTEDKVSDIGLGSSFQVVVLRFGKSSDAVCMQLDDIVSREEERVLHVVIQGADSRITHGRYLYRGCGRRTRCVGLSMIGAHLHPVL